MVLVYSYTWVEESKIKEEGVTCFSKAEPRSPTTTITTRYTYDALNRMKTRSYSDSTPAVTFAYDTPGTYSVGQLTQVSSSVSTTNYGPFDAMGRILGSSQTITDQTLGSQTYTLGYQYNFLGGITVETYPSGRQIATTYDTAGRPNGVTGTDSKIYVSSIAYAPHGAATSFVLGNSLTETMAYDPLRLQPTSIGLGSGIATFTYGYPAPPHNNGNVVNQGISATDANHNSINLSQTFQYDPLNRLSGISEGPFNASFIHDRFGNRTDGSSNATHLPTYYPVPSVDASTNRISDANFRYDYAGNLTQAPPAPGAAVQTFAYDGERRLTSFNNGVVVFSYDGEGNRVKKQVPASNAITFFVYDLNRNLVAEYSNTAAVGSGTKFITADALGSTRVVTDANQNVLARFDYLPFGEDMPTSIGNRSSVQGYNNTDDTRQKFTGHERDPETGLDHSFARDLATALGRFTSTDPYLGGMSPVEPQSMNLQSYVLNSPLSYVDPLGLQEGYPAVFDPPSEGGGIPAAGAPISYGPCTDFYYNNMYVGSSCGGVVRRLHRAIQLATAQTQPPNDGPPKSPARQDCEKKAQQKYSKAKAAAQISAEKGILIGWAVTAGLQGVGGCLVGSGLGVSIGTLLGGVSVFGTTPVGCITGGVSAAVEGLPLSIPAGLVTGGVTYYLDASAAQERYQEDMKACSQIP